MITCNKGLQLGGGPPPIPRSAGGGSSIPYVFSSSGVEQRDTSRDILKMMKNWRREDDLWMKRSHIQYLSHEIETRKGTIN